MRKRNKALLILVIILAFLVRLYRLNFPLADWHSWRQADTASVSRRYLQEGIDLLHPRYDDLSSIPSGKPNPQGWRFVEFPFYNFIHTLITQSFPILTLEVWGRLVSVFFSLGSLLFLFFMVKKLIDEKTALFSAFFFAFLPFNIFYSRVILPEPMMVFFSLGFIYFFLVWLGKVQKEKSNLFSLLLFTLFLTLAVLTKPYVLFLGLPLLYFSFKELKLKFIRLDLVLSIIFAILAFFAWRWWAGHFPEGIPAYTWLLNSTRIRFRPAFFRWLFAERLGKLILGYWGTLFLVLGLIRKPEKKEGWFFHWWLVSILLYLIVFATGNVTHDYYQVIAIPVICVFLAKGSVLFLNLPKNLFSRLACYLSLIVCYLFMFSFSWFYVRDFFNINRSEIVEAGQIVDELTPQDALVIAPYGGDTAFLYQTKRQGWPVGGQIKDKIKRGAKFFVSVDFNQETKDLMLRCPILKKTERFVIIALEECIF